MKSKIIILGIITIVMSSCGIYKKYEPTTTVPENLYGEEVSLNDSSTLASLSWEELFTDPQLRSIINKALTGNLDLQSAELRIEQAKASLTSAKLAYLPSFMLTPQGNAMSFDKSKPVWGYTGVVSASWEIDAFGKLTNAKRGSKAGYLQSLEYRQAVVSSLISNVANLYYTLLMLDEQYRISNETAAAWEESVKTMRLMKEAGMTNAAAISQSEANYMSVKTSVLELAQQINEIQNTLCVLLGEVPSDIERGSIYTATFPENLSVGVPVELLAMRPDVRSAEYAVASAFYATNAARSAFYPSISLGGTAGWTNTAGVAIMNPGSLILNAIGSLTQPLFNKGLNRAQLKIAKAQQEQAQLSFQQTILNAGKEVNDAMTQIQTAKSKKAIRVDQITSLETAVHSTKLLMQHGSSTYLDVLTAQQSLLSAQLQQVADLFSEIQGTINLYQSLGGGRID